jgi:hypothetical protein
MVGRTKRKDIFPVLCPSLSPRNDVAALCASSFTTDNARDVSASNQSTVTKLLVVMSGAETFRNRCSSTSWFGACFNEKPLSWTKWFTVFVLSIMRWTEIFRLRSLLTTFYKTSRFFTDWCDGGIFLNLGVVSFAHISCKNRSATIFNNTGYSVISLFSFWSQSTKFSNLLAMFVAVVTTFISSRSVTTRCAAGMSIHSTNVYCASVKSTQAASTFCGAREVKTGHYENS